MDIVRPPALPRVEGASRDARLEVDFSCALLAALLMGLLASAADGPAACATCATWHSKTQARMLIEYQMQENKPTPALLCLTCRSVRSRLPGSSRPLAVA